MASTFTTNVTQAVVSLVCQPERLPFGLVASPAGIAAICSLSAVTGVCLGMVLGGGVVWYYLRGAGVQQGVPAQHHAGYGGHY